MMAGGGPPHDLGALPVAILAGGLGTRLRGTLDPALPKVLAPVAGRPFLAWLLDHLAGFGFRRFHLLLGVKADPVRRFLVDRQGKHPAESVTVHQEPEPLGTAGAVAFARHDLGEAAMVLNGDTWLDLPLDRFAAAGLTNAAPGTMLAVEVADAGRYGRLAIDRNDRLIGFREKGEAGPGWINGGAYLLKGPLLDAIAARRTGSIETDVFETLAPGTLAVHRASGRFLDIGTPESLAAAAAVIAGAEERSIPAVAATEQGP